MRIAGQLYKQLMKIPRFPFEFGGILGGKNNVIFKMVLDCKIRVKNKKVYVPNTRKLNQRIREWSEKEIQFYGFFHSHLTNEGTLSKEDEEYIEQIVSVVLLEGEELYFPVLLPQRELFIYKAQKYQKQTVIEGDTLEIVEL